MALQDSYILAADPNFQGRVQSALLLACNNIATEGSTSVIFHRERQTFAAQIMSATGGSQAGYVTLFANAVATNATVVSDATGAGSVALTTTNRSTAASQVTDTDINNAVAQLFNAFIREPAN